MAVVIHTWARSGTSIMRGAIANVSAYNPYAKLEAFTCTSIDTHPFAACADFGIIGPGYITESCYNSLGSEEKAIAPTRFAGMVTDTGYWIARRNADGSYSHRFNPDSIIPFPADDPCKDVSCPDKCVGVDKYDQVCQDGICVRGTLIETNSEHCGYTPEPEPDPTPTPSSDMYVVIALMLAGTYLVLRR